MDVPEMASHTYKEVQKNGKCDICGKGVTFGIKVSHSHRRSNRTWKPNVKRESNRQWHAMPYLRLHPLLTFRVK